MDYGINSIVNFCKNTTNTTRKAINKITMFDIYTFGITAILVAQLIPKCKNIIDKRQVYKKQIIDYVTDNRISNAEMVVSVIAKKMNDTEIAVSNIRTATVAGAGTSSLGYSNYECDITPSVNSLPMFQSYCPQQPLQPPLQARQRKTPLQPPPYVVQPQTPQYIQPQKSHDIRDAGKYPINSSEKTFIYGEPIFRPAIGKKYI